jgi:hypothetical protein
MQMDNTALQGAARMDDSGTMKRADNDMGRVIAQPPRSEPMCRFMEGDRDEDRDNPS